MPEAPYRMWKCATEGCPNELRNHYWGSIVKSASGWYLAANGKNYCPKHAPPSSSKDA